MKKVYRTTKVNANGVQIAVRQVLGRGQDRAPAMIAQAAAQAQIWLSLAIAADPRTDTRINSIFKHCFRIDPGSAEVSTVRAVLSTLKGSMARPYAVKVNTAGSGTYGYVNYAMNTRPHLINGMIQYDDDGTTLVRQGEIHVCLYAMDVGLEMATVTLIHEASHKFANMRDHDARGYFDGKNHTFMQPGLTWQEALWNADSYAVYCLKVAKARGAVAAPPSDDEDLDLSSLFG